MPSVCSPADARQLLNDVIRSRPAAVVLCDSFVTSEAFVTSCSALFEPLINVKAEKVVLIVPCLCHKN
jgi:hypothetical protein